MCGIVGYIGNRKANEVLIPSLKRLEYRGYDSAGIALANNTTCQIIKSVGKIINLEKKLNKKDLDSYHLGIAHTRWATHGAVTEVNAHPQQYGKITIVHNGIIENVDNIKEKLQRENIKFKSETDTEVIAVLLNKYLESNFIKTINKVMNLLKGSFALGIINQDEANKLYIVKKSSPVVIGVGDNENFFASDISAINYFTNKFIFLDDNEIAEITQEKIVVYNGCNIISKNVNTINTDINDYDKKGYPHFMLKEINEQPQILKNTLTKYLNDIKLLPDLTSYQELHIVACGSAMYAGMIGKQLFEQQAHIKTYVEVASEYRYQEQLYNEKTLVIVISQSGETADTIAALRKAKKQKQDTLAIVNVKNSTIARDADNCLYTEAFEEIAVATTKAYTLQVALLSLLSLKLAYDKGYITDLDKYLKDFRQLPNYLKKVIAQDQKYQEIAKVIYKSKDVFFIGRKIDYAICLEGSLKLKEISYIHSEAYQAGELKHGTISLIDKGTPVFAIITDQSIADKTMSNLIETTSRGANGYLITTESLKTGFAQEIIVKDATNFVQPLLVIPILQLIAYYTACLKKCDVDKPKNLAKSVTVE